MSESSEQLIQRFRERLKQVERSRMIRPPELADFVDEHEVEELLDHIDHLTAELARRQQQVETLRAACERMVQAAETWAVKTWAVSIIELALAATAEPSGEGGGR